MDCLRAVWGLLALRSAAGRMPELYRAALGQPDPLHWLVTSSELQRGWPKLANVLRDKKELDAAAVQIMSWSKAEIRTVPLGELDYPAALLTIFDPPPVLFVEGELTSSKFTFAVVGSRSADSIAFSAARAISFELAQSGATVVSGLALGVDTAAHRGSLEVERELPTIAVLGTGLDRIYPAANRELARTIVERGGALISQFEPGSQIFPSNFIARNRIIAGFSRGVAVLQAAKNSGSLATARFALEEGRDVFIVPGSFGDKRYEGSHQLLRDGAIVVTAPTDIIDYYPELERRAASGKSGIVAEPGKSPVLKALNGPGSLSIEELVEKTQLAPAELEATLLELELAGTIDRLPGNRIRLGHLN